MILQTILNPKTARVIKKQALFDEDANKLWSKPCKKKLRFFFSFLIDIATIAMVAEYTKPTEDEHKTFNEA